MLISMPFTSSTIKASFALSKSLAILNQIITETDENKTRDLTHLFNANQNKKTMVRVNKLSNLLDTITDQALARFTARPDEISNNKEASLLFIEAMESAWKYYETASK